MCTCVFVCVCIVDLLYLHSMSSLWFDFSLCWRGCICIIIINNRIFVFLIASGIYLSNFVLFGCVCVCVYNNNNDDDDNGKFFLCVSWFIRSNKHEMIVSLKSLVFLKKLHNTKIYHLKINSNLIDWLISSTGTFIRSSRILVK